MKIIVNADDLGKNKEMNTAISAYLDKGLVTSSTIMAGGNNLEEGVAIAKKHPDCSFGVHLDLDEFYSISKSGVLKRYGIVDENNRFVRHAFNKQRIYTDELLSAVYNEWNMQIRKVRGFGIEISHLDSHHHIHTYRPLLPVFLKVLDDNKIRRARICERKSIALLLKHMNEERTLSGGGSFFTEIKHSVSSYFWTKKVRKSANVVDFFCQYQYFLNNYDVIASVYRNGIIEVMCHPGHPLYQDETLALDKVNSMGELISYNQI